ncbi:uncharacterized protein LOC143450539 [Clavelina lepadiformis]|uniref:uncharacterized protein LOC143450539 n=1 Tax=Clavelina lepadiformis TaxID=159417 RepID=UPI00404202AD
MRMESIPIWACLIVTFAAFLPGSYAFPFGAPTQVCGSLTPLGHTFRGHTSDPNLGYTLQANPTTISPGDNVSIQVPGTLRGLVMQVRPSLDGNAIGNWQTPNAGFKFLECFDNRQSTVTHSNSNNKDGASFTWTAPGGSCQSATYFVRATVLQSFASFQEDVVLQLRCVEPSPQTPPPQTLPPPPQTILPPILPPTPEVLPFVPPGGGNLCRFSSLTSVPASGYRTSFETEDFGGWINTGVRQWQRNRGQTQSYSTGPNGAFDGDFYAYFDASSPAQPGDRAVLETSPNLRGCFCFQFSASMFVSRRNPPHRLFVELGNEVLNIPIRDDANWVQRSLQIDSDEFTAIRIVGERGVDWMGDVAIDQLRVTPGSCP